MKKQSESKKRDYILRCSNCKEQYEIDDYGKFYRCEKCNDLLEIRRTAPGKIGRNGRAGVWKYFDLIPLWDEENIVSLSEGNTNLIECRNLAKLLGIKSLYVKFEGQNPTGSFKDRGMTVGVSKAVELGYRNVICASTGNTSSSLAAYSARAGLKCNVLIPKGRIAMGKIAQAVVYGAEIIQVEGNFDDALRIATEICERNKNVLLLNSLNPFRIEGQKTLAFEVIEQLGTIPDYVVLPVGNGGNITSIWKGFGEILQDSDQKSPKMIAIQAEGSAPIANAFKLGKRDSIVPVENPLTEASAINIGSPVSWRKALGAIYESGGLADSVSDTEIFAAQKLLASNEGIFVEPASATPIAFLSRLRTSPGRNEKLKDSTIVCVATGNGLKDPNAVMKEISPDKFRTIQPEEKSLEIL